MHPMRQNRAFRPIDILDSVVAAAGAARRWESVREQPRGDDLGRPMEGCPAGVPRLLGVRTVPQAARRLPRRRGPAHGLAGQGRARGTARRLHRVDGFPGARERDVPDAPDRRGARRSRRPEHHGGARPRCRRRDRAEGPAGTLARVRARRARRRPLARGPGLDVQLEDSSSSYDIATNQRHKGDVTLRTKLFVRSRLADKTGQ